MFGLRTKFKVNEAVSIMVLKKPWSSSLGISLEDKQDYIVVLDNNREYSLIDDEGENDGFDTFGGAEQFARAYIKANYDLDSTRTIPQYKLETGKRFNPATGEYIEI